MNWQRISNLRAIKKKVLESMLKCSRLQLGPITNYKSYGVCILMKLLPNVIRIFSKTFLNLYSEDTDGSLMTQAKLS